MWAPFAERVAVMGSFNEWSKEANPLSKDETGCWTGRVDGAIVGQEYKYFIKNGDQEFERNDPRALQLTAAGDACVIVGDNDFDWGDDKFVIAPPNQRLVYELHVGTFNRPDPATPGTFATAATKLDYLAALGVNVIEVMPVSGTNVDRWWGYDPTYLYAVDAAYGGRRAFLEFIKAAHSHGIAVIVDVVYNHLSPFPGLDLWQFDGWNENGRGGIYFYNDDRGDTPWGPRPDYGRPEVRRYISDNVRMWLGDCRIDGIRVDATFAIRNRAGRNNDPATDLPDGWKLLQELTEAARAVKPDSMVVAEDMSVNEWITKPVSEGGAGFGAQWETSFPSTIRNIVNPVNDADRHLQSLEDALVKTYNGDPFQRVLYGESHDADANGHARLNEEVSPGDPASLFARRRSAMAAAIIMTAPGIPMLFQGQEFMESGWFNHWKALDWSKAESYQGIVTLYQHLAALRHDRYGHTRGLTGPNYTTLFLDEMSKVMAYRRWDVGGPGDDTVVILNASNQTLSGFDIWFPHPGIWQVRFNSDWQGYSQDFTGVQMPAVEVVKNNGTVNIGPYTVLILSQEPAGQ